MPRERSPYELRMERDDDLLMAYRSLLDKASHISLSGIMAELAQAPARRFWVSEDRAVSVVSRILGGNTPRLSRNKLAMFVEIARRAARMMAESGATMRAAVAAVIEQPAPSFYITALSAKTLVARARRRKKARNEGGHKGDTRRERAQDKEA